MSCGIMFIVHQDTRPPKPRETVRGFLAVEFPILGRGVASIDRPDC